MTMKPEFPIGTTHGMLFVDYSSSEDGGRTILNVLVVRFCTKPDVQRFSGCLSKL